VKSKFLSSFMLSAVFTLAFSLISSVSALAAIEVYMDGVELHYTDVQPQILNNRTMVPLAATAEHFGMTYVWNGATRTMVFSGNGRTMIHTVYDNKIYVNGIPVEFDFTSIIVNDRTLMPIRMLAEAIGCVVEWDDSGIVDIWTDVGSHSTPAPSAQAPAPAQVSEPQTPTELITIYAVAQNKTNIEAGQEVRISVDTNKAANIVKITDFDGHLITESTNYTEDSQGRYFDISINPDQDGENSLIIYAGNDDGYSLSSKNLTVTVTKIVKNIFIESIRLSSKAVEPGKDVDIVFYTSKNVKRVTIFDEDGYAVRKLNNRNDYTDNHYIWDNYIFAENKPGDYVYTITAYDEAGASESATFNLTVKSASTVNTDKVIQKVEYEKVAARAKCDLTVTTGTAAQKLIVRDRYDELLREISTPPTASGSTRIWNFYIRIDYSDDYYIYVYDSNGDELERRTESIDVE